MTTKRKRPLALLAAVLALTGCAVSAPAAPALAQELPAVPALTAPAPESETLPEPADPMLEKYVDVLEGVFYDHVLPDGQLLEAFEDDDTFFNRFALYDIDGDGAQELLLCHDNAPSAWMIGAVYGYDRDSGRLTTQLLEYPAMTFYPNGVVEVGWSHNQGLAGRFWPCTFYAYDPDADLYRPVACVDAWDREVFETDFDGNPFPAGADPEGEGIVYYIWQYGSGEEPAPISQGEYSDWYHALIGGDPAVEIPWQALNEGNIEDLS